MEWVPSGHYTQCPAEIEKGKICPAVAGMPSDGTKIGKFCPTEAGRALAGTENSKFCPTKVERALAGTKIGKFCPAEAERALAGTENGKFGTAETGKTSAGQKMHNLVLQQKDNMVVGVQKRVSNASGVPWRSLIGRAGNNRAAFRSRPAQQTTTRARAKAL